MKTHLKWLAVILFSVIITGCSNATEVLPTQTDTIAARTFTRTPTKTPLVVQIPTRTLSQSLTPTERSNTLIPTVPTFTPTFDASNQITITPANPQKCPQENRDLLPWIPECNEFGSCSGGPYYQDILDYLNMGGTLKNLKSKIGGEVVDLTGDGLNEYLNYDPGIVYVYGCSGGQYVILGQESGDFATPNIELIKDLNKDGLPEIVLSDYVGYQEYALKILEWDRKEFVNLIDIEEDNSHSDYLLTSDWVITDINNDNIKEIVNTVNAPVREEFFADGLPWRKSEVTLGWNGQNYIISNTEFATPQYRFQAIQDGDRAARNFKFDKAIAFYQDAIFSDKLDWWSKERKEYERELNFNVWFAEEERMSDLPTSTPLPTEMYPVEDTSEYFRLAAYAYFRMIVIHVLRNEMDAAQIKYETMHKKFLPDSFGYPYLEMATALMYAFQQSQNMTDACEAVIDYAARNRDILVPLGSDYHGAQSLIYKPKDVCPFR